MINVLYLFKVLECGHFCINYVLNADKKKKKIKYNKQMMSLGLVKRVLKQYYTNSECYYVNDIFELQKDKHFITLLRMGDNKFHYVVVNKIDFKYIYYYDPLFLSPRRVKVEKFLKKWTRYCCVFS